MAGVLPAMRGQKVWRQAHAALCAAGFEVADARPTGTTHVLVTVRRGEASVRISISSSPRDADNAVNRAVKDAWRKLREIH